MHLLYMLIVATGAMMVGEERFCSLAHGCKQCPICKSKVRLYLCWHGAFACEWRMMHSCALKQMVQCVA